MSTNQGNQFDSNNNQVHNSQQQLGQQQTQQLDVENMVQSDQQPYSQQLKAGDGKPDLSIATKQQQSSQKQMESNGGAPSFNDDNGQEQLTQQQIEKQLIEQAAGNDGSDDDVESNSTSNLNLDSGTLKEQGAGGGTADKQMLQHGQIDYFKNFDYDKNQRKDADEDQYLEPPSFLLNNNNNKIDQYQTSQQQKDGGGGSTQMLQDSLMLDIKSALQPTIQESEQIEESAEQKSVVKRAQGLPQPYDSTVYYDFKDFPDYKWEPFKDEKTCPPSWYFDARNMENNGDKMENLLKGGTTKPILFDLQNTWLKGEQYAHILQNQDRYCQVFGIQKYEFKQHPESIYIDPKDGLLYFVEGATIGSDFGFPRLGIRKRFKWKKMNFTTDLPKRDPLVSYIVASAVKCEKFFPGSNDDGPVYRMHAVILKKRDPTLQIPSVGDSDPQSAKKLEAQLSQENMNDKANDQQPRSKHGRVLTKSTKLKASQINSSQSTKKNDNAPPGAQQNTINDDLLNKNYILCHVRRVMGKRDDEFDSDNADEASPIKKEGNQTQLEGQRQSSKIPNKGKSKYDQIPLQFSEDSQSPCKDKKIPNLEMFQGKSLEQIKKMKVGPDGKPLSLYKIKKYILPYNKMLSDQMKNNGNKLNEESADSENHETEHAQSNQQSKAARGRKRQNPVPVQELDRQTSLNSVQVKEESFQGENVKKEPSKDVQPAKKQINVDMIDEQKSNKQETFNNSQRVIDGNDPVSQMHSILDQQDLNVLNPNNHLNIGNQNQFQLDQALALNFLNNNNAFGQNYLGLQHPFGPVNGLMLNQLGVGALQNFGGQNQAGLNQLLGANPNNLGLSTADLALQNQLLGLQGNIGLNNFATAGNLGINNINNLLRVNLAQSVNFNGLLNQQNPLNSLNNLQIQQLLANQVGANNPQLKLSNLNNNNNDLFMMNQQANNLNVNGNRLGADQASSNAGHQKKRDSKMMKKLDSVRLGEPQKNSAISPNLLGKDALNNVSPQLKNFGNNLLGPMLGNAYLNGQNLAGNLKRKQTSDQPNLFKDELTTNDFFMHIEKEYTRRLSGQMKTNIDDLNSKNGSPKSHNLSTFMKSPNIQPMTQKLHDQLHNQKMQSSMLNNKRRASFVSNFGRDRINSKVSAFKKFDSMLGNKQKDQATSPLIQGKNGEPSFGQESIQDSKSVNTIKAPKNSVETSTIQNISKKNDSNVGSQNNKAGNKNGADNSQIEQQLQQFQLLKYQQLMTQLPGGTAQNVDQLTQMNLGCNKKNQIPNFANFNNLGNNLGNPLQPNMQQTAQFGSNNNSGNFNQNLQNDVNRSLLNMNDLTNNVTGGNQQMKNGNNQQSQQQQQQFLLQLSQQQLLLNWQYRVNQILNPSLAVSAANMGNTNFNPLDILQQGPQLFQNPVDKAGADQMNQLNGKNHHHNLNAHNNDNQQINQQINIIQNSTIQPDISRLIVNQMGGGGNPQQDGANANNNQQYQGRKDSYTHKQSKNTSTQSPNIASQVRSRKNSSNNAHQQNSFLNQLKMALAPNPSMGGMGGMGAQPQDHMPADDGTLRAPGSSMMIPPPNHKQNSHRNSNVSTSNIMNFGGPRKSTDISPFNKHKFSITGAVINNPAANMPTPSQQHLNNIKSQQLSNTSNKGGTHSHPISQENQHQVSSPDRHLDSSYSQKQDLGDKSKMSLSEPFMKMPSQRHDLMKSPGISGSHHPGHQLQNSRRQSNNIDLMGAGSGNKYPGTAGAGFQQQAHQQVFMAPISRHSSQMAMPMNNQNNNNSSLGGGHGLQEPGSSARISDEQPKQISSGGLKNTK